MLYDIDNLKEPPPKRSFADTMRRQALNNSRKKREYYIDRQITTPPSPSSLPCKKIIIDENIYLTPNPNNNELSHPRSYAPIAAAILATMIGLVLYIINYNPKNTNNIITNKNRM